MRGLSPFQGSWKEDTFKLVFRKKRIRIRVTLGRVSTKQDTMMDRLLRRRVSTEQDAITIAPEWGLYGAVIQTSIPHSSIQQATSKKS